MIPLKWSKWYRLQDIDPSKINEFGVYTIWYAGSTSRVVKVGQGNVAQRLKEHQSDPAILKFGNLYVSWASVNSRQVDGVERYLANAYQPLVGERFPNVLGIPVNSPWD